MKNSDAKASGHFRRRNVAFACLLINRWDRRHSWEEACGAAKRFSLSPAEGERTGVRGEAARPLNTTTFSSSTPPLTLTLSPSEGEREADVER